MKTLIIHPDDRSTDFLKIIYEGMKDITVLTGNGMMQQDIKNMIPEYDRVMIMGHGTPYGLLSTSNFIGYRGYIIDSSFTKLLKDNPNNVYIWCNADMFVNVHSLQGFHTGMFISEVDEALFFRITTDQKTVDESNIEFSKIVKKYRSKPVMELYRGVKKHYGKLAETNEIADYNNNRIYIKEKRYGKTS